MAEKQTIIIAGASARAAAFSALRAGLEPYCFDLFADADLALRCPVVKVDVAGYPRNLLKAIRQAPPGPWMYTGGLENHPRLVDAISRERPLWGNPGHILRALRSPRWLTKHFKESRRFPEARRDPPEDTAPGRWIAKPFSSSGGRGIRFWDPVTSQKGHCYYQQFIAGTSMSAVFFTARDDAWLSGATEQLIGEVWLHAPQFAYCGSITAVGFPLGFIHELNALKTQLLRDFVPRGLFGLDFIRSTDGLYLIEVNPRYTASIDLLEFATNGGYLAKHRQTFDATAPEVEPIGFRGINMGKAILFARESFTFPADGPWLADLDPRRPIEAMPAYADIPHAGSVIEKGWPVLTFFASGATVEEVREKLKGIAAELNERFWPQSCAL